MDYRRQIGFLRRVGQSWINAFTIALHHGVKWILFGAIRGLKLAYTEGWEAEKLKGWEAENYGKKWKSYRFIIPNSENISHCVNDVTPTRYWLSLRPLRYFASRSIIIQIENIVPLIKVKWLIIKLFCLLHVVGIGHDQRLMLLVLLLFLHLQSWNYYIQNDFIVDFRLETIIDIL